MAPTNKFANSGITLSGLISAGFNNGNLNGVLQGATNDIGVGDSLLIARGSYTGSAGDLHDLEFQLDTSGIDNGTYHMYVILDDYAGNSSVTNYYLYVVNPLQFVDVTQLEGNQLSLNFSTSIKVSGVLESSGVETALRIEVVRSNFSDFGTSNFNSLMLSANRRSIIVTIVQNVEDDQFRFEDGDTITAKIQADGIAKLFNLNDDPILQLTPNNRMLTWFSSSAPPA